LERCGYNLVIGKRLKICCGLPFGALGIVDRHSGFILCRTLFTHYWRHGRAGRRAVDGRAGVRFRFRSMGGRAIRQAGGRAFGWSI